MDLKDINTFGSIIHTKNNKYIGILYDPYFTKFQGIIEKELKIIDDIFPQNILNNLLDKQNKDNDDKKINISYIMKILLEKAKLEQNSSHLKKDFLFISYFHQEKRRI